MADHSGWRLGIASAPIHHGEILQGVFPHEGGLTRGLVTLPCTIYKTHATFMPAPGAELTVSPAWKTKALRAAELTIAAIRPDGEHPVGGHLDLSGDVPLCRGFGSSTSDVLATIWAVKDAFVSALAPEDVARLAVQAELASDSLMFEETSVLFAQRDGEVIEDFGYRMPPVRVLGFGSRPQNNGQGVDTLAFPPASYGTDETRSFAELQAMLRDAIQTKDAALLGAVATASTEINQRHLPIPDLDRIRWIVREVGALGVQAAHSGDIAGILFDRDDRDVEARTEHAKDLLHSTGIHEQWIFTTGD
ncbi:MULTISPECIES: GHMP family kinase ATP-binding protein [Streptomyces]|uniref:Kinase n=1 Tax=Streptomyces griseofuscus TaxID=146922 RepID=A0A426RXX0_9ACTN|nr:MULTISPECIES: kinase [Streptomyces]MYR85554.1 kinase [Streptomyces sp. SID685]RRQ80058.1 kinase [Streptomyces griseofuscus]RRQ82162.1 kinase [Streptomyces griseofuscus]